MFTTAYVSDRQWLRLGRAGLTTRRGVPPRQAVAPRPTPASRAGFASRPVAPRPHTPRAAAAPRAAQAARRTLGPLGLAWRLCSQSDRRASCRCRASAAAPLLRPRQPPEARHTRPRD
eukprot:scaffold90769_cov60-Phaeocystis_antarctica.AAC.2